MEKEQVNWGNVGIRMVQGLTTVIETIRQLDVQEASLVMRLLGKSCCKMMKSGVGHHFGLALIDASAQIAIKDRLVLEDVIAILSSIIGKLYLVAESDEERALVAQLDQVVQDYQIT
ncbi:MAG TPA: recombinase [Verrucomicrobiae bacterium]|nr:recombinase [Verrucomicrobiae bacterium]